MHLDWFHINIVRLKPQNGGKGSGELCHFQKSLWTSTMILARMKHKRKYTMLNYFWLHSNKGTGIIYDHKKKKVAWFSNKCVYAPKHRKLVDFVLTQDMFCLLLSHGQSPHRDRIDSHQPSDFPEAPGLPGCVVQHHPPSATRVAFLYHQKYLRKVLVWRHPLKNSVRFYGLPIIHLYWRRH